MEAFRINRRTYRWHDEDYIQSIDGLPDQFGWSTWPRHILNVEGERGFFIRVRIDHGLRHVQKKGRGIRARKEWAYDRWLPFVPYSWRPELEYFRDTPIMFGPVLVLGAGFATSKITGTSQYRASYQAENCRFPKPHTRYGCRFTINTMDL